MSLLTTDQKAQIIARQKFTIKEIQQILHDYPDYIVFAVHESEQIFFINTEQPNKERLGLKLAEMCAADENLYDFFDGVLAAADKILEEKE